MRAERTQYGVPGWAVGTLWTDAAGVVLAHELDFTDGRTPARARLPSGHAGAIVEKVRAFFAGEDALAEVPIEPGPCTPFGHALLEALRSVPRGEVVTYGELAALAGRPAAARAAGTFCARNRFALLVPCHRVVASAGIGGYGSTGVAVKRRLLALEGVLL